MASFHSVDTYVKTYLAEDDRRFLRKRTALARQPFVYRQTVKYLSSDVPRRTLLVMVWAKNNFSDFAHRNPGDFYTHEREHRGHHPSNNCLGAAEVNISKIIPKQMVVGWYKLFPPDYYNPESDSN